MTALAPSLPSTTPCRLFAAHTNVNWTIDTLNAAQYPAVLWSYAYPSTPGCLDYRPEVIYTDSGAYTAWQVGTAFDVAAYIEWCQKVRDGDYAERFLYISLDVIPGRRGKRPTERERREGMEGSLANGDAMREAGLPVMEVYHQYEPRAFLDTLLERRRPGEVLGIAPRQGQGVASRYEFCDAIFRYVLDRFGRDALPPLHGLGVGGRRLVLRYPWYSTDSTGWIRSGAWGKVKAGRREVKEPVKTLHRPYRTRAAVEFLREWERWTEAAARRWQERGVRWAT